MKIVLLISSFLYVSSLFLPPPTYSCSGKDNKGVCRPIGDTSLYPTYNYTVFVDYFDNMSLKVYAFSPEFPSYTCIIYGWLTPRELTLQCIAERESLTMPQTLYCSANKDMAICVNE